MSKKPTARTGSNPNGMRSSASHEALKSAQAHLWAAMDEMRPALVNTALLLPDQEQAEEHLKSLLRAAYLSLHGKEAGAVAAELDFAEADLEDLEQRLSDVTQKMSETPQYLAASPLNQNCTEASPDPVPFRQWSLRHKLESCLLAIGLPAMLAASGITTFSALMASGLPVFHENPMLAIAMSGLPGFGSIAIKSMGSNFRSDKAHRRFALAVYLIALGSLGTWGFAFADQFHGVGGGSLDILGDEEPVWKEKLLVASQLAAEVALGCAFFVRFERIARTYDPDAWIENLEFLTQSKHHAALGSDRPHMRGVVAQYRGENLSHQSALDLQIELALISYRAKRARGSEPTI